MMMVVPGTHDDGGAMVWWEKGNSNVCVCVCAVCGVRCVVREGLCGEGGYAWSVRISITGHESSSSSSSNGVSSQDEGLANRLYPCSNGGRAVRARSGDAGETRERNTCV